MTQADPGTRSPGRLVIEYQTQGIEHLSAAWFLANIDFDTQLSDIRDTAIAMANAIMDSCPNTSFAHSWHIVDQDGVQLVAENFEAPIAGTRTASDTIPSQSVQVSVTGKGSSGSVLLKAGRTRTSVFNGMFSSAFELAKDFTIVADGVLYDLLIFLRENDFVGADKFGQKATYAQIGLIQINAHWQREYGL